MILVKTFSGSHSIFVAIAIVRREGRLSLREFWQQLLLLLPLPNLTNADAQASEEKRDRLNNRKQKPNTAMRSSLQTNKN
mmetsp:Transcript_32746/g.64904  ORF Transcript_32746/g.64904 Transcript_32746/m.64904 type:complete len:80 (-) Transcript_32746:243-482(-)